MTRPLEEPLFTYRNLDEIRLRKEIIRREIQTDDVKIKALWGELFHNKQAFTASTPSKRFSGLMNTGAGILDGVILGWKLYHKFKKKK